MKNHPALRKAAAEFAAITVGVLVALAIDSAWSARGDRILEAQYLDQIVEEVEANARRVGSTISGADTATARLDRARRIAAAPNPTDSAGGLLLALAGGTSFLTTPIVSRAVVQDLISTGNLQLIRDASVRQMILAMDAIVLGRLDITRRAEADVGSRLEPLISRRLPPGAVKRTSAAEGYDLMIDEDAATPAELARAAELILADPEFESEINAEYRRLQRGRETAERLQATLEAYAGLLAEAAQTVENGGNP